MSSSHKRLDLRFGAFACSVQGFEDPVQPIQQVLRAIQHLLEESPELADTGINFDAEAIEQLVGEVARRADLDEAEVEIVPGLIMIHHGSGARESAAAAWEPTAEADAGDYVNIFSPSGGAEDGPAAESSEAESAEDFADRLRRMADTEGDDYGWDEDGADAGDAGGVEAADVQAEAEEAAPLNLFAGGAEASDEPAGTGAADSPRNLFAVPEDEPEDEPRQEAGEVQQGESREESEDNWELLLDAPSGEDAEAPVEESEGYSAAMLAERAGARGVPDQMVASAAWMVLIQGQTTFKRRDVLDVFETIPGAEERSLEARIKGFGKAMRNGRLVMIEDGIFGLSRGELERFQDLL